MKHHFRFLGSAILLSVLSWSVYAYDAVDIAVSELGSTYGYGDEGPDTFDCSGLTQYAYGHVGVVLPRRAISQSSIGVPVAKESLQRGDLVFFANTAVEREAGIVGHVGIVVSGNSMVNAVWDKEVQYGDLSEGWPKDFYLFARRISAPGPSTKFAIGDTVEVTEDDVAVRDLKADWRRIGTRLSRDTGRIKSLPIYFDGYWRWEVNFESGKDGWVAEDYLIKGFGEGETVDATPGKMGPLCLARLRDATSRVPPGYHPVIMFTVAASSTCKTDTCVNSTIAAFTSLGITAQVNPFSFANPRLFPNTPACVGYRSDIFQEFGMGGRGRFEAACVAAFLGAPFKLSDLGCSGDGFLVPAVLD